MSSFLFTLASFIVALGVLITVHEFGHFWVARTLGVKVLRFSVGFGKPLFTYREKQRASTPDAGISDGTEYVVAAIPLGGYVKMLDEREGDVSEGERHRAFNRQSLSVRTAIVAAGPIFNFLFAIFAFWLINVTGDLGARPLIGKVVEGSVAAGAGFQADDEIVSVGDSITPSWETAVYAMLSESLPGESLSIRVLDSSGSERLRMLQGDVLLSLAEGGQLLKEMGVVPKRPLIPPVLGEISAGGPAAVAGLRQGDRVLLVDGEEVGDWSRFVAYIQQRPGERIEMQIQRDRMSETIGVDVGQKVVDGRLVGRIGAGVAVPEDLYDQYRVEIRYGPLEAIGVASIRTWDTSVFMLRILGRMLVGEVSVKNLSGPISIAQTAGKSASYGFTQFLKFLALVSVSLGVLNLLPVPVLDGGHLLFFLIEAIKGSPLSEEAQAQGQRVGLLLLLALMGLAFYVDLSRLLG